MFSKFRISEIPTIEASKQLKKSKKYIPLDANAFKQISTKKNVKNMESIWDMMIGSVDNYSEKVRSKRIKPA